MRLHRNALGAMALAVTLAVAAAGCGGSGTPGAGDRLTVVTGFYPLQFVAERVGGDRVQATSLAQPGAEPHDLELTTSQVRSMYDAAAVIHLRGFQPAVDKVIDQSGVAALDVTSVVELLTLSQTGGEHGHEHGEEEGPQDEATDPHVWLDPTRLATIASAVAARLGELDPDGAAGYQERARALTAELTALDDEYAAALAQCERREIVVSHAAFGYLAHRYDLAQIAITGLSPDTEPTPDELATAAQEAREHGATTIFFETLVSPAVAQAVADTVGANTAVLDPIEGLQPGSSGDYLSVMRANLSTLRTALACT